MSCKKSRILLCALLFALGLQTGSAWAASAVIVTPAGASAAERLAAREVRRYVYLRTGELLETSQAAGRGDAILVARQDRAPVQDVLGSEPAAELEPQEFILKTHTRTGRKLLVIAGGDEVGTLYGAYRLAEHLGVRFYMEGDVIPDERTAFKLPDLDEHGSPIFELRGIQPFHDFPEGPDWWSVDAYKAVISQLPKMRMNFFGLHTYPQGGVGPEPVVWIGREQDMGEDGRVKASYPSRHFSTLNGTWGYQPRKTSEYLFGASMLFDDDAYCQDVQKGLTPWPETSEQCNQFFNAFGDKLRAAFEHARSLGVKTCIGTETPLIAPTPVRQRLQPEDGLVRVIGGRTADYGSPIEGTDDDPVYQCVRWNLQGYQFALPPGSYKVTLKFCEIAHQAAGKRVFGVKLQGRQVIEDLDIFARVGKNKALDFEFDDVRVAEAGMNIDFVPQVEYPCIAGIVIEGPTTLKVNCGSESAYQDFRIDEDLQPMQPEQIEQLYAGMFQRIMRTHPLDYYWFWTPEGWTWRDVSPEKVRQTMSDLQTAIRAARKVNATFELATCGWVLGPQTDRALFDRELPKTMSVSCISRAVGHDLVEPAFAEVEGRGKWAIPWLEDDPAMISTQLWAGRMRKDAADAKAYGCTGLMGIHWRTRTLGPNVSALAQASWDQTGWPMPTNRTLGAEGGRVQNFPDAAIEATDQDAVYQAQRMGLTNYNLAVPNGTHNVTLKFCELEHDAQGRRVFTVKIQGEPVLGNFDIFAEAGKGKALDKQFSVRVTDGWLHIEFISQAGEPCLAGVQNAGPYGGYAYNCGGPAWNTFLADPQPKPSTGRYWPVDDFYQDWALHAFGPRVAREAGELFARIDGNLPRPSNWVKGPGSIFPDARPWEEVRSEYAFVDELEALRPRVKGSGNLERFDYWLDSFRYLRANGRVNCLFHQQNELIEELNKQPDQQARASFAREHLLPLRIEIVRAVEQVYRHLLATVTNASELGTIANWEQHSLPGLLYEPGKVLAEALGQPLPADAVPSQAYAGKPRLVVPVARTAASPGELLALELLVLDSKPTPPVVYWRPMGGGEFNKVQSSRRARSVYEVSFPPDGLTQDIEYYVEAAASDGTLRFPAAAGQNHTVVLAD